MPNSIYRLIPRIDTVLKDPAIDDFPAPHELKLNSVREAVEDYRKSLSKESTDTSEIAFLKICKKAIELLKQSTAPYYKRVINATGIVLHTNMGRAVLSDRAQHYVADAIEGYSNLELDLDSGRRGNRYGRVLEMLKTITGAEAALVVNNNAAATLLALHTLCGNGEAIISKGELVEIGDSFRVPDLMMSCGTVLREVGTTNCTHLKDYENAICEKTKVLQKVYTSNYVVSGFCKSVSTAELVALGRKHGLPVLSDLGSGCLFKGIDGVEATPAGEIAAGADIVTSSGDKLLGGPQAGIIVGRKEYVSAMRKNPLMRALRVDKMTLAALDGTLTDYLDSSLAEKNIPVIRMIRTPYSELEARARDLCLRLKDVKNLKCQMEEGEAFVGGGSMPNVKLRSCIVQLSSELKAEALAAALRAWSTPIMTFVKDDKVIMDVRTMTEADVSEVIRAIKTIFER